MSRECTMIAAPVRRTWRGIRRRVDLHPGIRTSSLLSTVLCARQIMQRWSPIACGTSVESTMSVRSTVASVLSPRGGGWHRSKTPRSAVIGRRHRRGTANAYRLEARADERSVFLVQLPPSLMFNRIVRPVDHKRGHVNER